MVKVKCAVLFGAMVAAVALSGWDAAAAPQDKKGEKEKQPGGSVVGAKWDYKVMKGKGKGEVVADGTFRAHDFKIYKGGNQIGTYAVVGNNEYKLDITEGELKGKINLVPTKDKTYRGECEFDKHGKCNIVVTFKKD